MGLSINPTVIILFVIGAIIAVTALSTMLSETAISDYYGGVRTLEDSNTSTTAVDATNVSPLFILVATFVPVGIILAVLLYFFSTSRLL